ncbi:phosphotransferase [Nocardia carnea]|uniref:phosphotransferase n=1 Tax=Nocardia carnea TaxID=37328 RepID=UPI002458ED37|nr:phosphotransferase [Nocardia carnea]
MTDFATPQELARRTSAAVDAAVGAARALGIAVTDAAVLHDMFSVVVHLAPSPLVARVPTVLAPAQRVSLGSRQQAELDVTTWLAGQGVPVIAPSPAVPREPVRRDGFSMTFWQYMEEDRGAPPDYAANCDLVADLHAALRAYPGTLPFLSAAEPDFVTESLTVLGEYPELLDAADLDRARREWRVLAPLVGSRQGFEAAFPGIDLQPVHGDSPPANVFAGVNGNLFADFELVTLGPVEWDLAGLGPEWEAAYDRGARRNGLRPLDDGVLRFVNAVGMLRVVACLTLVPQQPVLHEYLTPALAQWRELPFAGGMAG